MSSSSSSWEPCIFSGQRSGSVPTRAGTSLPFWQALAISSRSMTSYAKSTQKYRPMWSKTARRTGGGCFMVRFWGMDGMSGRFSGSLRTARSWACSFLPACRIIASGWEKMPGSSCHTASPKGSFRLSCRVHVLGTQRGSATPARPAAWLCGFRRYQSQAERQNVGPCYRTRISIQLLQGRLRLGAHLAW